MRSLSKAGPQSDPERDIIKKYNSIVLVQGLGSSNSHGSHLITSIMDNTKVGDIQQKMSVHTYNILSRTQLVMIVDLS